MERLLESLWAIISFLSSFKRWPTVGFKRVPYARKCESRDRALWAATRKRKAARSILIDTLSRHMPKEVNDPIAGLIVASCGYRPWDQNCRRTLLTQLTDRFFGRNSPSHGIFSCKRLGFHFFSFNMPKREKIPFHFLFIWSSRTSSPDQIENGNMGRPSSWNILFFLVNVHHQDEHKKGMFRRRQEAHLWFHLFFLY